jgi:hypothetical protein
MARTQMNESLFASFSSEKEGACFVDDSIGGDCAAHEAGREAGNGALGLPCDLDVSSLKLAPAGVRA